MWIFLNDSFVSVVAHKRNEQLLLVRARIKGDLETLLGENTKVFSTPDNDYRFRAIVSKKQFAQVMKSRIENIDYKNFKDSVESDQRHNVYLGVWTVMYKFQEKLYGVKQWWLDYRNK